MFLIASRLKMLLSFIPQIGRPLVKNKTYYIAFEKGYKIQNEWYQISQSIKIMHCFSRECMGKKSMWCIWKDLISVTVKAYIMYASISDHLSFINNKSYVYKFKINNLLLCNDQKLSITIAKMLLV